MKTITINNVRFVVQAFDKDNFFNLSPIDNGDIHFDKKLGCIQFDLRQKKISFFTPVKIAPILWILSQK